LDDLDAIAEYYRVQSGPEEELDDGLGFLVEAQAHERDFCVVGASLFTFAFAHIPGDAEREQPP
jgi:hypothetical protein